MIHKEIKYKLQGNNDDSWEISEYEIFEEDNTGYLLTRYMIYEDPYKKPIPNVDVISMLKNMTSEELNEIKQILIS